MELVEAPKLYRLHVKDGTVLLTLDLYTDDFRKGSYLDDVHAL